MTREELRDYVDEQRGLNNIPYHVYSALIDGIDTLEQEPQSFKWCTDCKEYDQEKHCCHRWSKVIRDTVEEMKQEQEPILDKVRAEIEQLPTTKCTETCGIYIDADDFKKNVLVIIDKYKTRSEGKE